ncbi:hypothetical protein GUJ93_ZPchr0458g22352 [Zizania palustris]|uniref:Uncharacterized protein n=1 Tax=Zizania palustris TaxID=103762 RepID=A0A8J5QV94_ZIZPA|nr:hypothetical protein GUJ93_ZPchr0458g22352 [Zizania palustris]
MVVPALFVFGDLLVDDGNDNKLSCLAKGNFFPYAYDIDFPRGAATGRFCNGYTFVDALCACVIFWALAAVGGINYASAVGGILDETGQYPWRLERERAREAKLQ